MLETLAIASLHFVPLAMTWFGLITLTYLVSLGATLRDRSNSKLLYPSPLLAATLQEVRMHNPNNNNI